MKTQGLPASLVVNHIQALLGTPEHPADPRIERTVLAYLRSIFEERYGKSDTSALLIDDDTEFREQGEPEWWGPIGRSPVYIREKDWVELLDLIDKTSAVEFPSMWDPTIGNREYREVIAGTVCLWVKNAGEGDSASQERLYGFLRSFLQIAQAEEA